VPTVPFPIRRLWLLVHGAIVDRDHPDLTHLGSIEDPDRFVWAMLPHAARSFAPSILLLPENESRLAAIGYLYARMLDTYEDLSASPDDARQAISRFAGRFGTAIPGPAPAIDDATATDARDRFHLLLVERHSLIDEVFTGLGEVGRQRVVRMVQDMAKGMIEFASIFEDQGGVLESEDQVMAYCHRVIGVPATFTLDVILDDTAALHLAEALHVSELIQLANITRDVEKDLSRGVAYHRLLRAHLGSDGLGDAAGDVATAKRELMMMATRRADSFRRLLDAVDLPRLSPSRSAAVLMMLFTDRHYRRCAVESGLPTWSGPTWVGSMILTAIPAAFSASWADRILLRVERDLLAHS
jgi:phytoene/squalene synthetase